MRKIKKSNVIILIIILIYIGVLLFFKIFNNRIRPVLLRIANSECKKMATVIINDAVGKKLISSLTVDNLFSITYDNKGNITSIDLNSVIVNKVLTVTTNTAIYNLKLLEEGKVELLDLPESITVSYNMNDLKKGIIYKIPSGVMFNNSILSNVGPRIPVRFELIGSVTSNINTKITNYGINNALIEVYVDIKVTLEVILPYTKRKTSVETSIPIAIKMVQGLVPSYYSGASTNPSFSIPIE